MVICEFAKDCTTACRHRQPHEERKSGIAVYSYCNGICSGVRGEKMYYTHPTTCILAGNEEDIL
jgi:hypothetical protein